MGVCWHLWVSSFYTGDFYGCFMAALSVAFFQGLCE